MGSVRHVCDTDAWEADRDRFIAALPGLEQYRGQLGTDGATLLTAIESIQAVETIIANLYVYAGLRSYEDTRVSENAARFSEAQGLYAQYQQALSYFTPELLAISEETLDRNLSPHAGACCVHALPRRNSAHASLHPIGSRRKAACHGLGSAR